MFSLLYNSEKTQKPVVHENRRRTAVLEIVKPAHLVQKNAIVKITEIKLDAQTDG